MARSGAPTVVNLADSIADNTALKSYSFSSDP